MTETESVFQRGRRFGEKRAAAIWENLGKNNLWKRILKNVTATTLLVSICLIPGSRTAIGKAAYLGAITTVFGHPGRRFGQMAEALILVLSGTLLGVAWSLLGIYLGSLIIKEYPPAAYAIRAIFLAVVVLFHGTYIFERNSSCPYNFTGCETHSGSKRLLIPIRPVSSFKVLP